MKTASVPLSQQAYERIKALIRSLRLLPGSSVLETELATMLEMSRTPVHDALVRLESEGWVKLQPRQGAVINYVSPDDMREIYEVQEALESMAAQRAAEEGSDAEIAGLEAAVKDMESALEVDDLEAWMDADARFHELLWQLSGNRRIIEILRTFKEQSDYVRRLTIRLRRKPVESTRAHREVVEAIRARDGGRARALHQAHRGGAVRKELIDLLKSVMLPPFRV